MAGRVKKRLMDLSCLGQPQYFNSVRKVWLVIGIVLVASFGAPAQKSSTTQPASAPTIQPTPLPQVTPFSTPSLPVSPALPSPTPPTAPSQPALRQTAVHPELLTLDEALRLSSSLASNFQQA